MPQAAGIGALAILVLSWLTTLHFPPWVSWHAEALSFVAVFITAWTAIWRYGPDASDHCIDVPFVILPFVLFGVIAVAQGATGVMTFWGDVVVVWLYVALCIVCVVMGFNHTRWARAVECVGKRWPAPVLLASAIVVGAIVSAAFAFAQAFGLWEESGWIVHMPELRRPGGNMGQPNQLATLLVMGVASTAFLHASGRLSVRATLPLLLLLFAGIAASESRSGALGLVALLLWWHMKRRTIANQVPPWIVAVFVVVFGAMFMAWPQLLNMMELMREPVENRFIQGDIRLAVWTQLMEAVWQRPWWGWGIAEVAEAHNAVAHAYAENNPFSYSHNLVLDWAVWMGLPVASAMVAATALWLWRRLKKIDGPVAWFCLALGLPVATHSMLEFPFAYAYFLAPVMFLVGVLEHSVGAKPVLRIGVRSASVTLFALSAILVWSAAEYLSIEEDFRVVRFEQLRIGRTPSDHRRPDVVLLTQLGAVLTGWRIEIRPDMPAQDMEALRKLALRYPWVATQYRYAIALALNGQQPEAVRQLQVLRWQRGERVYAQVKVEIAELARTRHPQLRTLVLP